MRNVQRFCRVVAAIVVLPACLAACASPGSRRTSAEATCDRTRLEVAFVSDSDAITKEKVVESARRVADVLTSQAFSQACEASSMNRKGGRSVEAVCRQFACAGSRTIKVGLYDDPAMRAVAFEKSGVVFFNIAKDRAGSPDNFAHEFAHVLGYSHVTYWGVRPKHSVPYVVGRLVAQRLAVRNRTSSESRDAASSSAETSDDP
jgi:hypothetical protein